MVAISASADNNHACLSEMCSLNHEKVVVECYLEEVGCGIFLTCLRKKNNRQMQSY